MLAGWLLVDRYLECVPCAVNQFIQDTDVIVLQITRVRYDDGTLRLNLNLSECQIGAIKGCFVRLFNLQSVCSTNLPRCLAMFSHPSMIFAGPLHSP